MGMFDSVYIEKHACPKCGNELNGELQTKDLDCTLTAWKFPDFIADVDHEERRKILLFDYCGNCQWGDDWEGIIENQVLHILRPPNDLRNSMGIKTVSPIDELRDSLQTIQTLMAESHNRKSLALSFAVFIWKTYPEKRNVLSVILEERLNLPWGDFEKWNVRACLNPLDHAMGIIGGPQVVYWKLEEKSDSQKEKEYAFVTEAMTLPPGPERSAIVQAIDIEDFMKKHQAG